MKKYLGEFWLNGIRVKAFSVSGPDSEMWSVQKRTGKAEMYASIEADSFGKVAANIGHELFEFSVTEREGSYSPVAEFKPSCSRRLFVFDHQEYAQCMAMTMDAFEFVRPWYYKEWMKHKKKVQRESGSG